VKWSPYLRRAFVPQTEHIFRKVKSSWCGVVWPGRSKGTSRKHSRNFVYPMRLKLGLYVPGCCCSCVFHIIEHLKFPKHHHTKPTFTSIVQITHRSLAENWCILRLSKIVFPQLSISKYTPDPVAKSMQTPVNEIPIFPTSILPLQFILIV
jgi:hypothetical protein